MCGHTHPEGALPEGARAGLVYAGPHLATQLSRDQRIEFTELLDVMAAEEPHPSRRAFLEGFPEWFGLLEEDNGT